MSKFIVDEINNKIVEYTGTNKTVRIPEGIVEIDDFAFQYNCQIEEVYCPSTLKTIGYGAFEGCTALKKIHLNEGLTEILDNAFEKTGFKSINMPDSVNYIGNEAFKQAAIKTIELSKNLKKIPDGCFVYSNLKEIIIPENITEIGAAAFENCASL